MDLKELEALAQELNLTPHSSEVGNFSGVRKLYLTRIPGIRKLSANWMDVGSFKWTDPDQDIDDLLFQDRVVHEIQGFILHAQIQPFLGFSDMSDNTNTLKVVCSVAGYKKQGKLVGELPSDGIPGMYAWDNTTSNYSTNNPAPIVDSLGLVGSRGETCSQCIKNGNSSIEVGAKTSFCQPYGKMWIYVTTVYKFLKSKAPDGSLEISRIATPIRDIVPGSNGIIIEVNLPGKTGIKGMGNRDASKAIVGYAPYVASLARQFKSSINGDVRFNCTLLGIKPPPAGKVSNKSYLHFTNVPSFEISLLKEARKAWEELLKTSNISFEGSELDPALFGLDSEFKSSISESALIEEVEDAPFINPFVEDYNF